MTETEQFSLDLYRSTRSRAAYDRAARDAQAKGTTVLAYHDATLLRLNQIHEQLEAGRRISVEGAIAGAEPRDLTELRFESEPDAARLLLGDRLLVEVSYRLPSIDGSAGLSAVSGTRHWTFETGIESEAEGHLVSWFFALLRDRVRDRTGACDGPNGCGRSGQPDRSHA